MEGIENYKFGTPYTEKIPVEEADKFAAVFGEGSPALTELIKYCIVNGIITCASCKGHPEKKKPFDRLTSKGYITFGFDEYYDNDDFAYFLASVPSINGKIVAHLESNPMADRTITFYVPAKFKDESEQYFKYILEQLKKYKKMKEEDEQIDINPEIVEIVDHIFYSWKSNEAFDITQTSYKKYERQGFRLKKVATCPSNSETGELHKAFAAYLRRLKKMNIKDFVDYRGR